MSATLRRFEESLHRSWGAARRNSRAAWLMREANEVVVAALCDRRPRTVQLASPDADDGLRVTVTPELAVSTSRPAVGNGRALVTAVERAAAFARGLLVESAARRSSSDV